jgi:hypothetical protein
MTQEQTTTTAHPQFAPPPFIHLDSAAAQLGLTLEEAMEAHEECIRTQEEIQREIKEEDRLRCQQKELGEHSTPPPPPEYLAHNMADNHDEPPASFDSHGEPGNTASATQGDNTIGQLVCKLGAQPGAHIDWAEGTEEELGYRTQGEYLQYSYPT